MFGDQARGGPVLGLGATKNLREPTGPLAPPGNGVRRTLSESGTRFHRRATNNSSPHQAEKIRLFHPGQALKSNVLHIIAAGHRIR